MVFVVAVFKNELSFPSPHKDCSPFVIIPCNCKNNKELFVEIVFVQYVRQVLSNDKMQQSDIGDRGEILPSLLTLDITLENVWLSQLRRRAAEIKCIGATWVGARGDTKQPA